MEDNTFLNGPCQILPATDDRTSERTGCVKLSIPTHGTALEKIEPISVPGLLQQVALKYPEVVAYIYKNNNGNLVKVTYKEYMSQIRTCAKAFLKLGLEKLHSVCILGFNSPEWFISNLAAIYAGGICSGIYTTNSAEACYHCASLSSANIIVLEDELQYEKIAKIRHRLPHLKAVVQYSGIPKTKDVLSWKELMAIGSEQDDKNLNEALKKIAINQCCSIIFTSGTGGNPKAVMLSHDNITYELKAVSTALQMVPGDETLVSYLPLSHIAAQLVDIYLAFASASTIFFADKDALKGTLIQTLLEAKPTRFIGVPRVWEKIYEKMKVAAAQNWAIKRFLGNLAKSYALKHNMDIINGENSCNWGYSIASKFILSKVKQALGFSRCRTFVTAAAPLSLDIQKYFASLDMPLMEAYGMSECTGGHCVSTIEAFNFDAVGKPVVGVRSKIANLENGHGEICIYGRHVFMGYLGDLEKTNETKDSDGWLHTGDLGKMDEKGLVYVTGRLKELLITAGGENVPPVPIEQMLKSELPYVSQAILIGDKMKFLSVLITLETEVDPETGSPSQTLTKPVTKWLETLGCRATTLKEVLDAGPHPSLLKAIQEAINRVNEKSTSNAQKIQKFRILPRGLSMAFGEIGPTLKLKREVIMEHNKDIIESMYE